MPIVKQWRVQLYRDGQHERDVFLQCLGRMLEVALPWTLGEPFRSDIYDFVSADTHAGIIRAEFIETRTDPEWGAS